MSLVNDGFPYLGGGMFMEYTFCDLLCWESITLTSEANDPIPVPQLRSAVRRERRDARKRE